jgi:hypothetical protein
VREAGDCPSHEGRLKKVLVSPLTLSDGAVQAG